MATKGGTLARAFMRSFQNDTQRFLANQEYDKRAEQAAEYHKRRLAQENAYSLFRLEQEHGYDKKLERQKEKYGTGLAYQQHLYELEEIEARGKYGLEEAKIKGQDDSLKWQRLKFDEYKSQDAMYDTEIRELSTERLNLNKGDEFGMISAAAKERINQIDDIISEKQKIRRNLYNKYSGIPIQDIPVNKEPDVRNKTMTEFRRGYGFPTTRKYAERKGFNVIEEPVNDLRAQAINELKKAGQPVTEANIKEVIRQLSAD